MRDKGFEKTNEAIRFFELLEFVEKLQNFSVHFSVFTCNISHSKSKYTVEIYENDGANMSTESKESLLDAFECVLKELMLDFKDRCKKHDNQMKQLNSFLEDLKGV